MIILGLVQSAIWPLNPITLEFAERRPLLKVCTEPQLISLRELHPGRLTIASPAQQARRGQVEATMGGEGVPEITMANPPN